MSRPQTATEAGLDEVIDAVQEHLLRLDPFSDEFSKTVDQLDKLHKIRSSNKSDKDRVSMDGLLAVVGNLAGIALILSYERVHVVTSKALGFVTKSRI